jgi:large subunit ribosomal protein L13
MAWIIDATDLVLGRMATQIAKRLLNGETIHIVNAEKAIVSGTTKAAIRIGYMERYQLGTYRKGPFMSRMPHDLVKRTIRGMLPYQKPHGRDALKRIKAHIGVPSELKGQPTETLEGAKRRPHGTTMTIGELAAALGAPHRPEAA